MYPSLVYILFPRTQEARQTPKKNVSRIQKAARRRL